MAGNDGFEAKPRLKYEDYPRGKDAPVWSSSFPVPICEHGIPAEVQQSRDPDTAGRAFYTCGVKFNYCMPYSSPPCWFFEWIDGQEMYDPRIRLFPWHSGDTKPIQYFRRWVPPPPNRGELTAEKAVASAGRVINPPMCNCNVQSILVRPNPGVDFTPFFRCSRNDRDGWALCDFQEYIYGPKSCWPSSEEVEAFNSGEKDWPCEKYPFTICKCGILARRGVVPSELGYGWYCGNSYGDFWEGRTCDWERYEGQEEFEAEIHNLWQPYQDRKVEKRKEKIRHDYGVLMPSDEDKKKVLNDMRRVLGVPQRGYFTSSETLEFWRRRRGRYPPGVDLREMRQQKQLQYKMERERELEEYRNKMAEGTLIDQNANYRPNTWPAHLQTMRRNKAKMTVEMETMRDLVRNLPTVVPDDDEENDEDGDHE